MKHRALHPAFVIPLGTLAAVIAIGIVGVIAARRPSVTARVTIHNDQPKAVWVGVVREDGTCASATIAPGDQHRLVAFEGESDLDLHRERFVLLAVDPATSRVKSRTLEGREVDGIGADELGVLKMGDILAGLD